MSRARWCGVLATGALVMWGSAAQANQLVTVTIPAAPGQIASQWLSYPGPPRANVLLPTGYRPHKAYPLLVLLHGLESNYATWERAGAQQMLAGLNAIVVMPEGASGWYTDWWNYGQRGDPSWESYELDEMLPWVLQHYKILPERRSHAIAGVSMGGLGATYLGGRLPGFFGSVVSLSGFVDPGAFAPLVAEGEPLTSLAPLKGDWDFDAVEGPSGAFYATGHNPTALASNLSHTRLFVTTGNGQMTGAELKLLPGSLVSSLLEGGIIYRMNRAYRGALLAAGDTFTYQQHPGGHDNPNFTGEVAAMLAWGLFKPVASNPSSWVNQTVATSGQLWGIGYRFASPPDAVVEFRQSGRSLSVSAAGSSVTLTTQGGCTIQTATPATLTFPRRCTRRGPG